MNRRGFLGGLLALAAPAVITTPGLLMPVSTWALPTYGPGGVLTHEMIAREFNRKLQSRVPVSVNHGQNVSGVSFQFTRRDLELCMEEFAERYLAPAAASTAGSIGDGSLSVGMLLMPPWGNSHLSVNDGVGEHRGVMARALSHYDAACDGTMMRLDVLHS